MRQIPVWIPVTDEQMRDVSYISGYVNNRLTLMLRDPERLKRLLLHPERPVQLVIAGKAHPADEGGKLPLLSIFGGKITTYRKLAEQAVRALHAQLMNAQSRHPIAGSQECLICHHVGVVGSQITIVCKYINQYRKVRTFKIKVSKGRICS